MLSTILTVPTLTESIELATRVGPGGWEAS
jgi:hypothetical protein